MQRAPAYDIRTVADIGEVAHLFEAHHAYRSTGKVIAAAFGVYERGPEGDRAVAAFLWQPPAPGAAKSVCRELPQGVLALSRMVAVPREQRRLAHVSRPLRHQMRRLIDRTRWPVLVTYSDESVGHTGYVYKCSGWQPTVKNKNKTVTVDGKRVSTYSNGRQAEHATDAVIGGAWMQRWEHWVCTRMEAQPDGTEKVVGDRAGVVALFEQHWNKVPIQGKTWRSGNQAYRYERKPAT